MANEVAPDQHITLAKRIELLTYRYKETRNAAAIHLGCSVAAGLVSMEAMRINDFPLGALFASMGATAVAAGIGAERAIEATSLGHRVAALEAVQEQQEFVTRPEHAA